MASPFFAAEDIKAALRTELHRIADWWADHSVDRANGGFYGEIGLDGTPVPGAAKGAVLNARILWFFSACGMVTGDAAHRALADRARDYLLMHFLDTEAGGVFWLVNAEGQPVNRRKQGYAQAFALYGLAAHHRLTGDERSLSHAMDLFSLLERHFRDHAGRGYWEAFAHDFTPIEDMRLSERDAFAPKSMNTHLHILEAYTELFRTASSSALGAALGQLIDLHTDDIFRQEDGHLRLFWTDDWHDISETVSFGHDIEASWLLTEAADALDDPVRTEKARAVALKLAERTLEEASGPDGEVLNERRRSDGHVDDARIWWVQAEGFVGHLNAYQLCGDRRYADRAMHIWRFIERYVIDQDHEWRWHSAKDAAASPYWAGPWKGPYHNGRAMIEGLRRMEGIGS